MSEQGWKKRRALAGMRADEWNSDEKLAVRAERQRMADKAAAAGLAAVAEQEAALAAATCRCPTCGGMGHVPVERAMGAVEAWHNYAFQGYKPSKVSVAALAAIAKGEEPPAGSPVISFTYGSHSPAPTVAVASVTPASVEVVMAPKARPSKGEKTVETHDGYLIED